MKVKIIMDIKVRHFREQFIMGQKVTYLLEKLYEKYKLK